MWRVTWLLCDKTYWLVILRWYCWLHPQAEYKVKDKTIAAVKHLVSRVDVSEGRASRSRSRRSEVPLESSTGSESDIPSVMDKSTRMSSARSRVASEPRLPRSPRTPLSPHRSGHGLPSVASEPRIHTARSSIDVGFLDSVPSYFRVRVRFKIGKYPT
jgi:hypothetical protein